MLISTRSPIASCMRSTRHSSTESSLFWAHSFDLETPGNDQNLLPATAYYVEQKALYESNPTQVSVEERLPGCHLRDRELPWSGTVQIVLTETAAQSGVASFSRESLMANALRRATCSAVGYPEPGMSIVVLALV